MTTTNLDTLASTIAPILEPVLNVSPLIEIMRAPTGKIIFRADANYLARYSEEDVSPFDPFDVTDPPSADVYCAETRELVITKKHLQRMWRSMYFEYITNPKLHHVIADVLTMMLNEEQEWAKLYQNDGYHILQPHLSLEKIFTIHTPGRLTDYYSLRAEARDEDTWQKYVNEMWTGHAVRDVANDILRELRHAITRFFPVVRVFSERSLSPKHGYDVFSAEVEGTNQLVVKNLGDYRILHWELQK